MPDKTERIILRGGIRHTEISNEELLRILAEAGARVVENSTEIPVPTIRYAGFEKLPSEHRPEIELLAKFCASYLSGPIITDTFTDHRKRADWRKEMIRVHGSSFKDFYDNNRLGAKRIQALHLFFEVLKSSLEKNGIVSPQADRVKELAKKMSDISRYNELSLEDKLKFVAKLKEIAQDFLKLVTSDSTHA